MKKLTTLYLFFLFHFCLFGQEMLGIVNSNYSGIYGLSMNPSGMVGSRLYMDYNLLSVNTSFVNNYMFIERPDYDDWLFNGVLPVYYTSENEERNYTVSRNSRDKNGFYSFRSIGPSAMVVDGQHAFGITTAYRMNFSYHNLPLDISNFLYEAIDYDAQHGINYVHDKKIQTGTLSWFEVGLSYAYNFHRFRWNSWTAGITVKPLLGFLGSYTNLNHIDYIVYNDTVAFVRGATFDYSYSLPFDYTDNSYQPNPFIRGFGFSTDLGITYTRTAKGHSTQVFTRLCEQRYDKYNFKFGLSLLDFGYIKFTKEAVKKTFVETSTEWYKPYDTLPTHSVNEIATKVEYYFENNAAEAINSNKFTMNPPPAVCLQYDYSVKDYFFLNATVIWGFNIGNSYIKRPSVVSISPRFETTRFEACLPISIYEWNINVPQVGLALRYGNFFLGTDKLSTFIGLGDFMGFDFYLGLRLNISNMLRMNYIKEVCEQKKLHNIEMFDYRNF
jgi:hypothetical protein